MVGLGILSLALLATTSAPPPDENAKSLAQDILTKGAALFDTGDAAAMAATYLDDAELNLITKASAEGTYQAQVARGRAAIEQFYQKLFKERKSGSTSRNVVEYAHFVGSDLLIIHGTFALDVGQGEPIPFVQVRAKRDDRWQIMSLQLFLVSELGR